MRLAVEFQFQALILLEKLALKFDCGNQHALLFLAHSALAAPREFDAVQGYPVENLYEINFGCLKASFAILFIQKSVLDLVWHTNVKIVSK